MCRDFAPAEAGVPACRNSADQAGEICTYCRLSTARRTNQGSPHPVWAERVQALVLGGGFGAVQASCSSSGLLEMKNTPR